MQESERLLLEEQKDSVEQLQVLCQVVQIVQDNELRGPAAALVADGVENAVPDNDWDKLLKKQDKKDEADGGQEEVVHFEEVVELDGLARAHEFAATKDDQIIGYEGGYGCGEGRHGSLTGGELKIVGSPAHDCGEGFVEERP